MIGMTFQLSYDMDEVKLVETDLREYGGCLPLENRSVGNNPYIDMDKIELNCGRAGIYMSLLLNDADTLWIPYYICPTIGEYLDNRGIKVKYYNIDRNYLPLVPLLHSNEMILWPVYYGCMFNEIKTSIIECYGERLILDCTQALFLMPDDERPYYVYSIRKFLGVPEGGYLIKHGIENNKIKLERFSNRYDWDYLKECTSKGSNAVYESYKTNEERMKLKESYIEERTHDYLNEIDWGSIKEKRKQNFVYLHKQLKSINRLKIDYEAESPFMYPLYVEADMLRPYLINRKIYVPQWWKSVLKNRKALVHEKALARYIIPIPIDQRYGISDMEKIAKIVLEKVKK